MKLRLKKSTSNELKKMLIEVAKIKGINVCTLFEEEVDIWCFAFDPGGDYDIIYGTNDDSIRKYKEITVGGMLDAILNFKVPVKVQLTNDYTAIIDQENKVVKVGCQTIPFEKVVELYNKIK
jgi:hypothetical protein